MSSIFGGVSGGVSLSSSVAVGCTSITNYSTAAAAASWGPWAMPVAVMLGLAGFLVNRAQPIWHSFKRNFWSDSWDTVWSEYKKGRAAIMERTTSDAERQELLRELRQEFRNKYPEWAFKFN